MSAPRRHKLFPLLGACLGLGLGAGSLSACAEQPVANGDCRGDPIADLDPSSPSPEMACSEWPEPLDPRPLEWSMEVARGQSTPGISGYSFPFADLVSLGGARVLAVGGGELAAFDDGGERLWTYAPVSETLSRTNVTVLDDGLIAVSEDFGALGESKLLIIEADTGTLLNQIPVGTKIRQRPPPIIADGDWLWLLEYELNTPPDTSTVSLLHVHPGTDSMIELEQTWTHEIDSRVPELLRSGDGTMALFDRGLYPLDPDVAELSMDIAPLHGEEFHMVAARESGWIAVESTTKVSTYDAVIHAFDAGGTLEWTTRHDLGDLPPVRSDLALLPGGEIVLFTHESHFIATEATRRPLLLTFDGGGERVATQRFDVEGQGVGVRPLPGGGLMVLGTHQPVVFGTQLPDEGRWLARLAP